MSNQNIMSKNRQELIKFLKTNGLRADCPQCNGKMDLSKTTLFNAEHFTPEAKELLKQKKDFNKERKLELKNHAQKKSKKIETNTRSVKIGFILERLAPSLQSFRFDKNDCRSLVYPIDYVIFDGHDKTGSVQQIILWILKPDMQGRRNAKSIL